MYIHYNMQLYIVYIPLYRYLYVTDTFIIIRITVNDKSYKRENFHSLMGFVIMFGRTCFYNYLSSLTAKSISRENFCDSSKICGNRESLLLCNFCCLRYVCGSIYNKTIEGEIFTVFARLRKFPH